MWTTVKTFIFYLILLLRGNWHDAFTRHLIRGTKTRRNRKQLKGVTEELEEELRLSDGFSEDTSFIAFTKTGYIASFRIHRQGKGRYEMSQLLLEVPGTGQFTALDTRTSHLGQGPLQLRMMDPMRRWKVSFRGPLQRSDGEGQTRPIHAYLSFYWECIADPFDHWSNVSYWQMAKNFSSNDLWTGVKAVLSCNHHTWYEQWGMMRGRLELDGLLEETLTFRTLRTRSISLMTYSNNTKVSEHFLVDDGRLHFTTGALLDRSKAVRKFGSLVFPFGGRYAIDQSGLQLFCANDDEIALSYPFTANLREMSYRVESDKQRLTKLVWNNNGEDGTVAFKTLKVNGMIAFGVSVQKSGSIRVDTENNESACKRPIEQDVDLKKTIVSLESDEFCVPALVGGKASNLSTLYRLQTRVPMAICITTTALQYQADANKELHERICDLQKEGRRDMHKIQSMCNDIVRLFKSTTVEQELRQSIETQLHEIFGKNEFDKKRFAVRSSGVGEDGSESSSAGQMETFLGVRGLEQILTAVLSCWASSFTYQVVEYRRQNGQQFVDPMAVVIQEMVEADVAGVLFTNDPVSGNSTVMVINASPGLGEAVVSGESTPDTFRVTRGHGGHDIEITERRVGKRSFKIVMAEISGVERSNIENENATVPCLLENQIKELCRLGIELEQKLGRPQDIEWAIKDGTVYLLQTRPIVPLDLESTEDLVHEFDSPLALGKEFVTTGNVGEIAPGGLTPLTVGVLFGALNYCVVESARRSGGLPVSKYASKSFMTFSNRIFFNLTSFIAPLMYSIMTTKEKIEMFLLGEVVPKHTAELLEIYRGFGKSLFRELRVFAVDILFRDRYFIHRFHKMVKNVDNIDIGRGTKNALDLFSEIESSHSLFYVTWMLNVNQTRQSVLWTGILMGILKGNNKALSPENNADLTVLLSNCQNVYSAGVPTACKELAREIVESGNEEKFMALSDEDGHVFLVNACEPLRTKYKTFLNEQGHRCVKEVEFAVKSWAADPSVLIHSLKLLIKTGSYKAVDQQMLAPAEAVDLVKTPISPVAKFLMKKFLVSMARKGVAQREFGKSFTVKTQNKLKLAYWRLAEIMVRETRLPEEKMLFFLTHNEIGELLETRSPLLIRKAKRRMKVFALQDSIRFPKINFGVPVALTTTQQTRAVVGPSVTVTGMAVGRGQAEGRACIVQRLADADNIQHGDILICPYTDIGWTPYFSMISGLVTEMGGLLSHGSVVAREVGIPCVVDVTDVTSLFVTGDYVRIDGTAGTVTKLDGVTSNGMTEMLSKKQ